jgi:hypothetical protein
MFDAKFTVFTSICIYIKNLQFQLLLIVTFLAQNIVSALRKVNEGDLCAFTII